MKLISQTISIILLALAVPLSLQGQRVVSGTVTDAGSGESLIGANILVVGTSTGTITDIDGTFSLEVPAGYTKLQFSYTGYADQTIEIGVSNIVDARLQSGEILDEVVVIGYGTVKREDATGSVQAVGIKDFNRGAITGAQELLAGKIAGVVITPSADPGGGAAIRIRGGSSLAASNDPLIVVDGIPLDGDGASGSRNALNVVNPNDIETFTVLKDASATAIYGSRASNGVILITTKKANLADRFRVDYAGNVSFSKATNQVDVLNAEEFRALIVREFGAESPAADALGNENTNWQDQIYQTAVGTDHNVSFSGVEGNLPYRMSFGLTDKEGILKTDHFQRVTGALNLSPKFLDNRLQINFSLKGSTDQNRFANRGAIGSAVAFDPTQPVLSGNKAYGGYFAWLQNNGEPNPLAPANPLALLNLRKDRSNVDRIIVSGSVDYRFGFLPELRANLNLAHDLSNGSGRINVPDFASFSFNPLIGGGERNIYQQKKENSLLEFYLNYVKELGRAKIDVMGGYSWQHFLSESSFYSSNLRGTLVTEGENAGELYLLSFFGRANLTLFENLLLTATFRSDATSRFSPDTRWGLFPAFAVAYKFVSNRRGNLNDLKLRLGYGVTGQQNVTDNNYAYLPRYLAGFENAQYQFGDTFITTLRPEGYDENIKWEETTTYNIGIDFGLFNNRVSGAVELYQRETKDLINFIPVPAGTNLTNFILTNVGNLENRGIEVSLNLSPISNETSQWDLGVNMAYNRNEITKLTATDDPTYQGVLTGGISGGVGSTIQIHSVGFPASSFYVFQQVYDENGTPVEGLYVDRNGDKNINASDQYRVFQPAPKYSFGFTSNYTHGRWDFSFAGRANVGNYVYNNVLSNTATYGALRHPTNYLVNQHSAITDIDFQNPQYLSDHFLENASFLRIDHITLGYNFDSAGKGFSSMRVSAVLQNPNVFTKYSGIDPEIFGGIDNNIYPRSRTLVLGLNASF